MEWDSWEPVFWAIFFLMDIFLIASNLYQLVCLLDLEADYMNPYESSSLINKVVIPEMALNAVFCTLFLMTGHWFMFLVTLPITFYNMKLYMRRKHLIDVTEVFRFLRAEKQHRIIKLAFYLLLFILIIIRTFVAGTFSNMLSVLHSNNEEFDIRSMVLEY